MYRQMGYEDIIRWADNKIREKSLLLVGVTRMILYLTHLWEVVLPLKWHFLIIENGLVLNWMMIIVR